METVRFGCRGNGVLLLQLALSREGSYRGELDGIFGTRTLNGVRRFQSAHGLTPDGIAGPRTLRAAEPYLTGYFQTKLRPGDSFYRLAGRFGTSVEAIAAANPGFDPAELPVGESITIPLGFRVVPTDVPYSSALLEKILDGLTARYPLLTRTSIGDSRLGSPLEALKAGRGPRELFINAAHHANEWIMTPLVLDYIETLAKAQAAHGTVDGRSAAALLSRISLYVVPMVDPDGVDLVCGAIGQEGYARALEIAESFPDVPFPSGWKANIDGTDLNLNYPADWELAKKIKYAQGFSRPAPRDFVGEAPLCAPESRAVYDFTQRHDFARTLSFHTQGGQIYYAYKGFVPDGAEELARRMAEASGYELAEVPEESANAGYRDWFIEQYRLPGFTVEAGRGTNPLPLTQYDTIRRDVFPLITAFLDA